MYGAMNVRCDECAVRWRDDTNFIIIMYYLFVKWMMTCLEGTLFWISIEYVVFTFIDEWT